MNLGSWLTPKQITELQGMPSTIQGVHKKAKKEQWPVRKHEGVRGPGVEYLVHLHTDDKSEFVNINDSRVSFVVDKQYEIITTLNKYNIDLTAWEVLTLIARFEGAVLEDLSHHTKMPKSLLGRSIQLMSIEPLYGADGLDKTSHALHQLLEIKVDSSDFRQKKIYLTDVGKSFLSTVSQILIS